MSNPTPCPFCKSWKVVRYSYHFSNNIHYRCSKCGCLFIFDTKSKDAWNARPAEDALKAEIEQLKSFIEELTKPRTGGIKAAVQTARKEVLFGTDTNTPDTNIGMKESEAYNETTSN